MISVTLTGAIVKHVFHQLLNFKHNINVVAHYKSVITWLGSTYIKAWLFRNNIMARIVYLSWYGYLQIYEFKQPLYRPIV